MGGKDEVAVFTDTSLGTSLAMAVSPDITAADFKRVLGMEHINCFPLLGVIQVEGLMVKKKSHLYYLPDSIPIKHVFRGHHDAWFLHTKVRTTLDGSNRSGFSNSHGKKVYYNHNNTAIHIVKNGEQGDTVYETASEVPEADDGELMKQPVRSQHDAPDKSLPTANEGILKSKNEVKLAAEEKKNLQLKTPAKSSSAGGNSMQAQIWVGTLTNDQSLTAQVNALSPFMVQTPPRDSSYQSATAVRYGTPGSKSSKSDVGKRMVMAANNLKTPTNKYRSAVVFGRFRERELSRLKIPSLARFPMFEVSESDG